MFCHSRTESEFSINSGGNDTGEKMSKTVTINEEIFKAYDIRGVYPEEINEEVVDRVAKAFATLLMQENTDKKSLEVVVGQDMRISSPQLAEKAIEGLLSLGVNVVDIGLASTPTFYFAVGEGGYDGGLQISASHNPKEYNGIKIVRKKVYPVSLDDGIDKIRDIAVSGKFQILNSEGSVRQDNEILKKLVDYSLSFDGFSRIKPFKIVADVANAMGSLDLSALFEKLPCELIKMNFELDGTFPVHQADPFQEKNVVDLKKRVVETGADIGIATDGDGDRIFFIDDKGELIDPAILRGLFAEIVLRKNKGAAIGYDIRPGRITRDMIEQNGGVPFVTKVGHSFIKRIAIEKNSEFSGESSGHFFFKTDYGFFETPLIVTLYLLKEMSDRGVPISEIIAPLKKYFHSGEINFTVTDKEKVIEAIIEKYADGAEKVDKLDGLTIEHQDYWFNVRASNTEPLLRLNLEAKTSELVNEKVKEISAIIQS